MAGGRGRFPPSSGARALSGLVLALVVLAMEWAGCVLDGRPEVPHGAGICAHLRSFPQGHPQKDWVRAPARSLAAGSRLLSESVYLSVHTAGLGRTRLGQAGGGDSDIPGLGSVSSPSQLLRLGVLWGRGGVPARASKGRPTPSGGALGQAGRRPEGGAPEGGTRESSGGARSPGPHSWASGQDSAPVSGCSCPLCPLCTPAPSPALGFRLRHLPPHPPAGLWGPGGGPGRGAQLGWASP